MPVTVISSEYECLSHKFVLPSGRVNQSPAGQGTTLPQLQPEAAPAILFFGYDEASSK